MFNFFKKNKKYPPFDTLKKYDKQHSYFIRTAQWGWLDKDRIFVIDPHNPRILTFDPWPQLVFISANGEMTVTDYVLYTAGKYRGEIPDLLDKTIIDELKTLDEYGIIKFVEKKQKPESKFELPTIKKK